MRISNKLRYPSLNISKDIHPKNAPTKFEKDLKIIF